MDAFKVIHIRERVPLFVPSKRIETEWTTRRGSPGHNEQKKMRQGEVTFLATRTDTPEQEATGLQDEGREKPSQNKIRCDEGSQPSSTPLITNCHPLFRFQILPRGSRPPYQQPSQGTTTKTGETKDTSETRQAPADKNSRRVAAEEELRRWPRKKPSKPNNKQHWKN